MDRFWSKVSQAGGPDACWPWRQRVEANGYAQFWMEGRNHGAHRVAYYLTHGTWPTGQIDHQCHSDDPTCSGQGVACVHRSCCNPAHLRDATPSENQRARRTRCTKAGHPWVTEGVDYTVVPSDGRWRCLHCRRLARERVRREGTTLRKTVCKRGHDLTDSANLYTPPSGATVCRPCIQARRTEGRS